MLRLAPAVRGQLLIAVVRLALGVGGLMAARVVGAAAAPALLAFALGSFGFGISLVSAERAFAAADDPPPAPAHEREPAAVTLLAAAWPSTVGVAGLLGVALAVNGTLAALLAGVEAGMGVAALLGAARILARERELGGRLLVDRETRRVYLTAGRATGPTG